MPTLAKTQQKVDEFISAHWPTIIARQENYRANRGVYWQGLPTHSSVPAHSNSVDGSVIGDNLAQSPSDQFDNWLTVFPEWATEQLPAQFRINVYNGPEGQGWVLFADITHNARPYRRTINVGPESGRAMPWSDMTVEE